MYRSSKKINASRGQSLIEMALFVPILSIMMIGIFESAIVIKNYLVCQGAVREAVVQASRGATDDEIYQNLAENMSGIVEPALMIFELDPRQTRLVFRNQSSNVVRVSLAVRTGFYLPFLDYPFAFEYPVSAVRPVHKGVEITSTTQNYPADFIPWALQEGTYVLGTEYLLMPNKDAIHGNWRAIAYPNAGLGDYKKSLSEGYKGGKLRLDDKITVQPSNQNVASQSISQETLEGLLKRFENHLDETWLDYPDQNVNSSDTGLSPRVVMIPMVGDFPEANSAGEREIQDFGRFFLKGIYYADNGQPVDLTPGGSVFNANGTIKNIPSDAATRGVFCSGVFLERGLRWYEKADVKH